MGLQPKKCWQMPKLRVLARVRMEERILRNCKMRWGAPGGPLWPGVMCGTTSGRCDVIVNS